MSSTSPPSPGELRAMAQRLLAWADHPSASPPAAGRSADGDPRGVLLAFTEVMKGMRLLRMRLFPETPLGNPAWDVLLELTIRELNERRTSLDHLALDGEMPAATVYDAVERLVSQRLVVRTPDRFDGRVAWLELSERGRQSMHELLQEMAALIGLRAGATAD